MVGGNSSSVVELILRGKDEASDAFGSVMGSADGLGSALKLGVVGVAGLAVGSVVAVGKAAFDFSQDTEEAMKRVQAQTGLTGDDLLAFEQQAMDVFANNWGDSIGDVADAMVLTKQVTGEEGEELGNLTQNALILRDVFDQDVNGSLDASKVLMDEFGLSGQQAYDFITTGMQNGLNRNGDFLDTIGEYGGLFGDAGFSASEFYSIMETGGEGGPLGTDKIADAVKEMQIILNEGSEESALALDTIGLSYDDMAAAVSTGQATWADYFPDIIGGLQDTEDPILRNQAQVAIFGTMAEDLGASFTEGLSTATTSLEEMEGATTAAGDAVSTGLGPAWETFTRSALVAMKPFGDALGDLLMMMVPWLTEEGGKLTVFFDDLGNGIHAWIGVFDLAGIAWDAAKQKALEFIEPWWGFINAYVEFGEWLKTPLSFNIDISSIPEWMIPHSPLPIHTAWMNFGDDMKNLDLTPNLDVPGALPGVGAGGGGGLIPAGGGGNTININVQDAATGKQLLQLVRELQRNSTVTVRQ